MAKDDFEKNQIECEIDLPSQLTKKPRHTLSLLAKQFSPETKKTLKEEIEYEINLYESSHVEVGEFTDPLLYFKNNISVMLVLTKVVKMIFAAPASSVPSESLFSIAGQLITDKRNRLRPSLAESLLFLKENNY
jgi:hypothetical protein